MFSVERCESHIQNELPCGFRSTMVQDQRLQNDPIPVPIAVMTKNTTSEKKQTIFTAAGKSG